MSNYYIFRHAETQAVRKHSGYGAHQQNAPILREGKAATKRMAQYLKKVPCEIALCSEFERCAETAKIVEEITGQKFEFDRRLNEYYPDEGDSETFADLVTRVEDILFELSSKDYQNIWLCTHGALVSALIKLIQVGEVTWEEVQSFPEPGVLIELKEKGLKKIDFN